MITNYQLKIDGYIYKVFYVSIMVTKKEKLLVDRHKKKKKLKTPLQKTNHKETQQERKKRNKENR